MQSLFDLQEPQVQHSKEVETEDDDEYAANPSNVLLIDDEHLADQAGRCAKRHEHRRKAANKQQGVQEDGFAKLLALGDIRQLFDREAGNIREVGGDQGEHAGGQEGKQ